MQKRYWVYDLLVDSAFSLPELRPAVDTDHDRLPDLTIRINAVPARRPENNPQPRRLSWATRNRYWFCIPNVGSFFVENGSVITVDPEPGTNEESIRLFLLGAAMGMILHQRGLLVLHANAVKIDNKCMLCMGDAGAGKSTLAAGFMNRGYDILADDVVPIDHLCRAIPGFPRIKIWQEAANKLNINTHGLKLIRPDVNKFNLPIEHKNELTPLIVRWGFILTTHEHSHISVKPVYGMDRFGPLLANTYGNQHLSSMDRKPYHLHQCGKLSAQIHLAKIARPKVGFELEKLMDTLLEHMHKNP